jgi:hypothetical protein
MARHGELSESDLLLAIPRDAVDIHRILEAAGAHGRVPVLRV